MVKLFAIRQIFSDKIFDKRKKVEYRRQNVKIQPGEKCLVYTSSPAKRISGYFIVKEKLRLPLTELWAKTKKIAGITRETFFEYFKGCLEGTALIIKKVIKYFRKVTLQQLRSQIAGFRPPQSYYELDEVFLHKIKHLTEFA